MFNRNLLAAAAFALTAGVAFAQNTVTPIVVDPANPTNPVAREEKRDEFQHNRIQEGKANGSVTPMEARRLRLQQARIQRTERHDAKDGVVTPKEAQHVENMQDKASKNIYDQKHDGQGAISTPQQK